MEEFIMSLAVNIYYSGKNGNARKFAEEMERSGTASLIRNEQGNEKYEYYVPLNDPETIFLVDIWKNQASIDLHHSSVMMKTIMQLREKYDLRMKVERYITDEEGIPPADTEYIKE